MCFTEDLKVEFYYTTCLHIGHYEYKVFFPLYSGQNVLHYMRTLQALRFFIHLNIWFKKTVQI